MLYKKTLLVSSISEFKGIKPGQWFQIETGSRGQYMGKTAAGVDVVRWQNNKFTRRDAKANKHLRAFAVTYGSK